MGFVASSNEKPLPLFQDFARYHPSDGHDVCPLSPVVPENSDSISHGDFPEKKLGDILILQREISDGLAQHKEPSGRRLTCL